MEKSADSQDKKLRKQKELLKENGAYYNAHLIISLLYSEVSKPEVHTISDPIARSSIDIKLQKQKRYASTVSFALPETAASLAIAAAVVGTAATVLVRRTKATEANEIQLITCEDCDGSGLCSECKGEGFVLKKLSEESAERARLNAKNMATRYTAALPKKWSYCTKCSSARSCITCGGSGKLSY